MEISLQLIGYPTSKIVTNSSSGCLANQFSGDVSPGDCVVTEGGAWLPGRCLTCNIKRRFLPVIKVFWFHGWAECVHPRLGRQCLRHCDAKFSLGPKLCPIVCNRVVVVEFSFIDETREGQRDNALANGVCVNQGISLPGDSPVPIGVATPKVNHQFIPKKNG